MWRSAYHSATPPVQREFLCLSEALQLLSLRSVEDRLQVIPICFYEAPKEILMDHGEFLVRDTWLKKERSRSSPAHSAEPKAKLPMKEKLRGKPENRSPHDSGQERIVSWTFYSSSFTNSN